MDEAGKPPSARAWVVEKTVWGHAPRCKDTNEDGQEQNG